MECGEARGETGAMRRRLAIALIGAAMWGAGCGYHVAGRSDSLPKSIHVIAVPLLFDTATGRATAMVVTLKCEITFEERETGKILYHTDNFIFRNQYEISTDPGNADSVKNFFEEQDPALDRMARDFAERLVAAIVESY